MILSCSGLSKSYSGKEVLKNITFHIEEHDKLAIIGVNGAGKSTLLRILLNEEAYDDGIMTIAKNIRIGTLNQEHKFDLNKSIYETLEEPFEDLKKMGVVLKRALYFITCKGKMMYPIRMDEDYITRNLLNTKEKLPEGADGMSFRQLSLFDDMGIE